MRKTEIAKAPDNDLIVDYVLSYSRLCLNINLDRGTKQLSAHCADLENELVKRGLLKEADVKRLQG